MPLARLSIRSAVKLGRMRVQCRRHARGIATVRWSFPDGSPGQSCSFGDYKAARAKARELHIFLALLLLGVESTKALSAAARASPGKREYEVVCIYMEKLALTTH
jgi:hypothetical protein